tara:strand:+ start:520 stop:714 length:195 start_codon:yes stop_codon:yes gene_type:complete
MLLVSIIVLIIVHNSGEQTPEQEFNTINYDLINHQYGDERLDENGYPEGTSDEFNQYIKSLNNK